ncbi:hypothetical protein ACFORO_23365 [Amycolatopsis halotolerans]|uniref:Uncharacterized protein n=1 Tax=Amycolatopsis halotolerans TaxID=330083 RepID=A0ABV7QJY4_9PSEU
MQAERLDGSAQGAAAASGEVFDIEWPQQHRRWIATVDGTPTGGVYWLGHRTEEGDRAALVGTTPRLELRWPLGQLMNIVEPVGTMPDRSRVGAAVWRHLTEQAERRAEWPRVRWTVRDTKVEAAVLHFAGAWLAVSDQANLVVLGTGFPPEGLRFNGISGEEYGVDFTKPLTVEQLHRLRVWQLPQPETAHADLLKFLG